MSSIGGIGAQLVAQAVERSGAAAVSRLLEGLWAEPKKPGPGYDITRLIDHKADSSETSPKPVSMGGYFSKQLEDLLQEPKTGTLASLVGQHCPDTLLSALLVSLLPKKHFNLDIMVALNRWGEEKGGLKRIALCKLLSLFEDRERPGVLDPATPLMLCVVSKAADGSVVKCPQEGPDQNEKGWLVLDTTDISLKKLDDLVEGWKRWREEQELAAQDKFANTEVSDDPRRRKSRVTGFKLPPLTKSSKKRSSEIKLYDSEADRLRHLAKQIEGTRKKRLHIFPKSDAELMDLEYQKVDAYFETRFFDALAMAFRNTGVEYAAQTIAQSFKDGFVDLASLLELQHLPFKARDQVYDPYQKKLLRLVSTWCERSIREFRLRLKNDTQIHGDAYMLQIEEQLHPDLLKFGVEIFKPVLIEQFQSLAQDFESCLLRAVVNLDALTSNGLSLQTEVRAILELAFEDGALTAQQADRLVHLLEDAQALVELRIRQEEHQATLSSALMPNLNPHATESALRGQLRAILAVKEWLVQASAGAMSVGDENKPISVLRLLLTGIELKPQALSYFRWANPIRHAGLLNSNHDYRQAILERLQLTLSLLQKYMAQLDPHVEGEKRLLQQWQRALIEVRGAIAYVEELGQSIRPKTVPVDMIELCARLDHLASVSGQKTLSIVLEQSVQTIASVLPIEITDYAERSHSLDIAESIFKASHKSVQWILHANVNSPYLWLDHGNPYQTEDLHMASGILVLQSYLFRTYQLIRDGISPVIFGQDSWEHVSGEMILDFTLERMRHDSKIVTGPKHRRREQWHPWAVDMQRQLVSTSGQNAMWGGPFADLGLLYLRDAKTGKPMILSPKLLKEKSSWFDYANEAWGLFILGEDLNTKHAKKKWHLAALFQDSLRVVAQSVDASKNKEVFEKWFIREDVVEAAVGNVVTQMALMEPAPNASVFYEFGKELCQVSSFIEKKDEEKAADYTGDDLTGYIKDVEAKIARISMPMGALGAGKYHTKHIKPATEVVEEMRDKVREHGFMNRFNAFEFKDFRGDGTAGLETKAPTVTLGTLMQVLVADADKDALQELMDGVVDTFFSWKEENELFTIADYVESRRTKNRNWQAMVGGTYEMMLYALGGQSYLSAKVESLLVQHGVRDIFALHQARLGADAFFFTLMHAAFHGEQPTWKHFISNGVGFVAVGNVCRMAASLQIEKTIPSKLRTEFFEKLVKSFAVAEFGAVASAGLGWVHAQIEGADAGDIGKNIAYGFGQFLVLGWFFEKLYVAYPKLAPGAPIRAQLSEIGTLLAHAAETFNRANEALELAHSQRNAMLPANQRAALFEQLMAEAKRLFELAETLMTEAEGLAQRFSTDWIPYSIGKLFNYFRIPYSAQNAQEALARLCLHLGMGEQDSPVMRLLISVLGKNIPEPDLEFYTPPPTGPVADTPASNEETSLLPMWLNKQLKAATPIDWEYPLSLMPGTALNGFIEKYLAMISPQRGLQMTPVQLTLSLVDLLVKMYGPKPWFPDTWNRTLEAAYLLLTGELIAKAKQRIANRHTQIKDAYMGVLDAIESLDPSLLNLKHYDIVQALLEPGGIGKAQEIVNDISFESTAVRDAVNKAAKVVSEVEKAFKDRTTQTRERIEQTPEGELKDKTLEILDVLESMSADSLTEADFQLVSLLASDPPNIKAAYDIVIDEWYTRGFDREGEVNGARRYLRQLVIDAQSFVFAQNRELINIVREFSTGRPPHMREAIEILLFNFESLTLETFETGYYDILLLLSEPIKAADLIFAVERLKATTIRDLVLDIALEWMLCVDAGQRQSRSRGSFTGGDPYAGRGSEDGYVDIWTQDLAKFLAAEEPRSKVVILIYKRIRSKLVARYFPEDREGVMSGKYLTFIDALLFTQTDFLSALDANNNDYSKLCTELFSALWHAQAIERQAQNAGVPTGLVTELILLRVIHNSASTEVLNTSLIRDFLAQHGEARIEELLIEIVEHAPQFGLILIMNYINPMLVVEFSHQTPTQLQNTLGFRFVVDRRLALQLSCITATYKLQCTLNVLAKILRNRAGNASFSVAQQDVVTQTIGSCVNRIQGELNASILSENVDIMERVSFVLLDLFMPRAGGSGRDENTTILVALFDLVSQIGSVEFITDQLKLFKEVGLIPVPAQNFTPFKDALAIMRARGRTFQAKRLQSAWERVFGAQRTVLDSLISEFPMVHQDFVWALVDKGGVSIDSILNMLSLNPVPEDVLSKLVPLLATSSREQITSVANKADAVLFYYAAENEGDLEHSFTNLLLSSLVVLSGEGKEPSWLFSPKALSFIVARAFESESIDSFFESNTESARQLLESDLNIVLTEYTGLSRAEAFQRLFSYLKTVNMLNQPTPDDVTSLIVAQTWTLTWALAAKYRLMNDTDLSALVIEWAESIMRLSFDPNMNSLDRARSRVRILGVVEAAIDVMRERGQDDVGINLAVARLISELISQARYTLQTPGLSFGTADALVARTGDLTLEEYVNELKSVIDQLVRYDGQSPPELNAGSDDARLNRLDQVLGAGGAFKRAWSSLGGYGNTSNRDIAQHQQYILYCRAIRTHYQRWQAELDGLGENDRAIWQSYVESLARRSQAWGRRVLNQKVRQFKKRLQKTLENRSITRETFESLVDYYERTRADIIKMSEANQQLADDLSSVAIPGRELTGAADDLVDTWAELKPQLEAKIED